MSLFPSTTSKNNVIIRKIQQCRVVNCSAARFSILSNAYLKTVKASRLRELHLFAETPHQVLHHDTISTCSIYQVLGIRGL